MERIASQATIHQNFFPAHALPLETLAAVTPAVAGALPAPAPLPPVVLFPERIRAWALGELTAEDAASEEDGR